MKKLSFLLHSIVFSMAIAYTQPPVDGRTYATANQRADSVMATLSWDDRIAQLMMVAAYSNRDEKHVAGLESLAQKYTLGGVIFFQGGPVRQARFTNRLQSASRIPLLVAMDAEWGPSMRLDSVTEFPWQMMMAGASDSIARRQVFTDIATQLKRLGVNVSFSPVVDINSNPANPVIGSRAFGDDKEKVVAYSLTYMEELEKQGIMSVAKHFPGHGDTDTDSHLALPILNRHAQQLNSVELYPYRQLMARGLPAVMVAHMHVPAYDTTRAMPSTLSYAIVTQVLKDSLRFSGLVFTDALNMKGVSNAFPPGALEVRALAAGVDVLLMPADVSLAIDSVKRAIVDGRLDSLRVMEACRKVLVYKYLYGGDCNQQVSTEGLAESLNHTEFGLHRDALVRSALAVIKNDNNLLPLQRLDTLRIAALLPMGTDNALYTEMLRRYSRVDTIMVNAKPTLPQIVEILRRLDAYNLVICPLTGTNVFAARRYGLSVQMVALYDTLMLTRPVVLDVLTSPYAVTLFRNSAKAKAIVLSYHDKDWVKYWSAQLIFGGGTATGQQTVNLAGSEKYTHKGWDIPVRLSYTHPQKAGMDAGVLSQIDSVMAEAIAKRATPGGQILVARHGKVVYYKSFGYFTYLGEHAVANTDCYDLASLTKVLVTLPIAMRLYERGQLDLSKRLSYYLPRLEKTNKGRIEVLEMLTHQARLQPWIPFYLATMRGLYPEMNLFSKEFSFEYPYRLSDNNFMAKQITWRDGIFAHQPDSDFSVRVAPAMYMHRQWRDSVIYQMDASELRKKKEYKYSDLGFLYLQQIIETIAGSGIDTIGSQWFFAPLGAPSLRFGPVPDGFVSQVAPTENDLIFRRQLLQGYVHDPAAAMLGGVAGHAGLFGNANDVAKLMQMYLNGGTYGGQQYFTPPTVRYFTSCPYCKEGNRRGIGFDRPLQTPSANTTASLLASDQSFGHTGFTGTMAWADPATGLLFVFLSNRIHPDAGNNLLMDMNIRTKIHDIVYQSVLPE